MQRAIEAVHVSEAVGRYIVALAEATRQNPQLEVGASPRGTLALMKLTRVRAMLEGGLRRGEVVALTAGHIQPRDGRWVIVDLRGKHGRLRTIAVPAWVKQALDLWCAAPIAIVPVAEDSEGRSRPPCGC